MTSDVCFLVCIAVLLFIICLRNTAQQMAEFSSSVRNKDINTWAWCVFFC